jgi:hypothetical protein
LLGATLVLNIRFANSIMLLAGGWGEVIYEREIAGC